MKKCFCGFILFMLVFTVFGQNKKLVVAVSPFEIRGGFSQSDAETIYELFIAELVATNAITVVSRTSFDQIIQQLRFETTDWSSSTKVAQLGKALNANSIIRCTLMKLGDQLVITGNVLDINTAQILSSSRLQMNNINEIFTKMTGFVKDMVNNLPTPNYLIGSWRILNNDIILTFYADNTFIITNYKGLVHSDTTKEDVVGTASGTYRYTKNEIEALYVFSYTWERVEHSTGKRTRGSNREEISSKMSYSIDITRGELKLNPGFTRSISMSAFNPGYREYYNSFIRR